MSSDSDIKQIFKISGSDIEYIANMYDSPTPPPYIKLEKNNDIRYIQLYSNGNIPLEVSLGSNNYKINGIELIYVSLEYYAQNEIPNYTTITTIPDTNMKYLTSGILASDLNRMFLSCEKLKSIGDIFSKNNPTAIDTSNVTDMSSMFGYCYELEKIDLTALDTSNIKDFGYVFYNCTSLTNIDAIIDMRSCTYCNGMFSNCTKLTGVQIKNPPSDFTENSGLNSNQYTIVS